MAIFKMKSLAQSHALEDAERDYQAAVRVEQFRVSDRAIYFAAFPGTQYIPFDALSQVKVRNTALSVTGTCGKIRSSRPAAASRVSVSLLTTRSPQTRTASG